MIAGYLLDVCAEANRFYNGCRVLCDDEELTRARVVLTYCTTIVLHKGLGLLGMKAPEQM
jgi:arginyl-tRNA synthetase